MVSTSFQLGASALRCLRSIAASTTSLSVAPSAPSWLLPRVATSSTVQAPTVSRSFHTTPAVLKREKKSLASDSSRKAQAFKKLIYGLPPAPLRMARNRALRHWTIHRAWLLFRRQRREAKEKELYRMYQGISNACEELRRTVGPGHRDEGYLYRVAMEKKGVYGLDGIPIEYARHQTETPAREAWNHDWKR